MNRNNLIKYSVLIVTTVFILVSGIKKPIHNWDMISYVASAYYLDGYRGEELKNNTYFDIKAEVDAEKFSELTAGYYRQTVFREHKALEQNIPFYSTKFLYVEFMRALKFFGIQYAKSTYLISAIFASLSVIALATLILRQGIPFITLPIIVFFAGYVELGRLSTPDSMACFFSLIAIISLMNKSKLLFLMAAILPLIRPDYILLSALLMAYSFFQGKKLLASITLFASITAYLVVGKISTGYGWLTMFNFLIKVTPYPAEIIISHNISEYLKPYMDIAKSSWLNSHMLIYVISTYIYVANFKELIKEKTFYILYALPIAFASAHIILFPNYERRYFVIPISLLLVWIFSFLQFKKIQDVTSASIFLSKQ